MKSEDLARLLAAKGVDGAPVRCYDSEGYVYDIRALEVEYEAGAPTVWLKVQVV